MGLKEGTGTSGPSAKIYYFQGKAYYSLDAYNAAVAAYNAAQEAARRAAAAAQAAEQARRQSALHPTPSAPAAPIVPPPPGPNLDEERRRQAAAQAAAVRARLIAEAADRARRIQAQLKVEAARRAALIKQQQELKLRQAEVRDMLRVQAQEQRPEEVRREQRIIQERMAAAARARAYEELQERNRILQNAAAWKLNRMMRDELVTQQKENEAQIRAGIEWVPTRFGGVQEGVDPGTTLGGETIIRRNEVLEQARETGDWTDAVALLEEQNAATGGYFLDEGLFAAVIDELAVPVQQVGDEFMAEENKLRDAINAGDMETAYEIYESPRYKRLLEEYLKWYGDPFNEVEGAFEPIYEKLAAIESRRERIRIGLALGAPRGATDADIAQMIKQQARAIEVQKQAELADMTLQERGYMTLPDGEKIPYKGRRDGDYTTDWEAYYERKSDEFTAQQKEAVRKAQNYQREIIGLLKTDGMTNIRYEGGNLTWEDPVQSRWVREMLRLMPNDFQKRAETLDRLRFDDPYAFQQNVKTFVADAERLWVEQHPQPPYEVSSNYATRSKAPVYQAPTQYELWLAEKRKFLTQTQRALTGEDYGIAQILGGSPFEPVLSGALSFWGAITSLPRWFGQQALGQKYQPFVDVHLLGTGAKESGWRGKGMTENWLEFGRVYDENADAAWGMVQEALDSGDFGRIGAALREYSQWGQGNVGWLLTQLTDPTQMMSLPSRNVAMALARSGGARAVVSRGRLGFSEFLQHFVELSKPTGDLVRRLRGGALRVGRERNLEWGRIKMAQALEISYKDVMHASDDVWNDIVREFTQQKATRELTKEMTDFFNKSALNPDVVMARAEAQIAKIAKKYNLLSADPIRIAKQMADVETLLIQARRAVADAESEIARRAAQKSAAEALDKLRQRFPKALSKPKPRQLASDVLAEHERLLRAYTGSADEFLKRATHAKSLLDQISELGRTAKRAPDVDDLKMGQLQRELRKTIGSMSQMRDKVLHLPGSPDDPLGTITRQTKEGVVSRNWRKLQEYRATIGGDPNAPSFGALKDAEIAKDFAYLTNRVRGLTAAIKKARQAKDAAEVERLTKERDLARSAFAGLKFEREARSNRALARRATKEFPEIVDQAVQRRQLGGFATSPLERVRETVRSLANRLGHAEIIDLPAMDDAERALLDRVIPRLRDVDATRMLKAAGYEEFGKMSLLEAAQVFEKFRGTGAVRAAEFAPVWKKIVDHIRSEMVAAGWRPYKGFANVNDLLAKLRYEHVRNGSEPIGLKRLEELDAVVAKALREARNSRAEGLVRKSKKAPPTRQRLSDSALLYHADADPRDVLTKIRALEGTGVDLYQYDMVRSVLGDVMRKNWAMESILADAKRIAAKTGRDIEEVYTEVWKNRARSESRREFEEFALRPEFQGLTPRQLVTAFEEEYMARIMGRGNAGMTQYQFDSLEMAYQESAKHPWGNMKAMEMLLSGEARAAPGTRLITGSDLPGRLAQDVGDALVHHVEDEDLVMRWIDGAADHNPLREVREPFSVPEFANLDEIRRLEAKFDAAAASEVATTVTKRTKPISGLVKYARSVSKDPILRRRKFRQRLWARMQTSAEFRQLIVDVGGASEDEMAKFAGEFSEDIVRARKWLRSNEGLRAFPKDLKVSREGLKALRGTGTGRWNAARIHELKQMQAAYQHIVAGRRNLAGIVAQVTVDDSYVSKLRGALGSVSDQTAERIEEMLEDAVVSGGAKQVPDTARAARPEIIMGKPTGKMIQPMKTIREAKTYKLPIRDLDYIVTQLRDEADQAIGDIISFKDPATGRYTTKKSPLRKLADELPTASELLDDDPKLFSWSTPVGKDAHAHYRKMLEAERALQIIKDELGYYHGLKRDINGKLKGVFVWFDGDEVGESARMLAPGIYVFGDVDVETIAHEIMHAMWRMPDNEALIDELVTWVGRMGHETELLNKVKIEGAEGALGNKQEIISELYGMWYSKSKRWGEVYASMDEAGRMAMDYLESRFDDMHMPLRDQFGYGGRVPPFGNRTKLSNWLVDNGYWPKRLGEQIARGERVWSIADERKFFQFNWGYTPPWTDEKIMAPLLNNPKALEVAFRAWGMMDDGYERLSTGIDLQAHQLQASVAWGAEGFARKRTLSEMRRYAIERYGALVSKDGKTLDRMPWLMGTDDEYLRWVRESLDESAKPRIKAEWESAFEGLPEPIQKALFDGDTVKADGLDLLRGNLKPTELEALNDALVKAIEKRLKRMRSIKGDPDPRHFLPQEQVRFAYEVTNELLADQRWRAIVKGSAKGTAWNMVKATPRMMTGIWAGLFRALVSWQPAFIIMNLIDSYGFKRIYLQVAENGFRPLGWDKEGRALVRNLAEVGLESRGIFALKEGVSSFSEIITRVGDRDLSWNVRGGAAAGGLFRLPVLVSKLGEDRLRLQFAQSVAGKTYRGALARGMTVEAAENLARADARRIGALYFAKHTGHPILELMDHLFPFFTYNYKNAMVAVKIGMDHPQVFAWADRINFRIEEENRKRWEEIYPGIPFPENLGIADDFTIMIGGQPYQIDLSSWSDWTRALRSLTTSQDAMDFVENFIRFPHPAQGGLWALLTNGETPWGKPGHIRELSAWADLLLWMNGNDYTDWDDQRDGIQMLSQMLFFKKWGRMHPVKIKNMTFWNMKEAGDDEAAEAYLAANPDLQAYWAANGKRTPLPSAEHRLHRRSLLSDAENELYNASMDEFDKLNRALELTLLPFAKEPWSEEYRAAKKRANDMRNSFIARHPELIDMWTIFQSPGEFARLEIGWKLDQEIEEFFSLDKPKRGDFKSELAYQQAMVKYYDGREKFLDSHPAVMKALYGQRTAIEGAYHDVELMWSETLEAQARLKIQILEEELKGADADRDMIGILYDIRSDLSLALDNERYGSFPTDARGNPLSLGENLQKIPGFGAIIRAGQTPEQRAASDANLRYARGITAVVENSTDGKTFYDLLKKDPWLLKEYWRRNPDAKARYEAGQAYYNAISPWGIALKNGNFTLAQQIWDNLPAWVKERYFEANPDSKMRDGMGGGSTAVEYNGKWFKSTASRDRYIQFIENGGSDGDFPDGFAPSGQFSSPEARMRFIRGQEYYARIGGWIDLLKAKEYDEADKYFRSMPEWMQEKYFEKHPDQRARFELDSAMLRAGANYFLASGGDKEKILKKNPALARWLAEHGGDEAVHRGLLIAIYRNIPSSEPWLKRTFRERYPEVFSQEAAAERRFASVARDLAENPEVLPFYERAVKLQYELFKEQFKLSKTPPDPWTLERKRRFAKRRRRRAARLHSRWSMYRDMRRAEYEPMHRNVRP